MLGMVGLEYKSDEVAELRRMSVSKNARRCGVATILTRHLLEFAKAEGYRKVVLSTLNVHVGACKLYEKMGFVLVHTKHVPERGFDVIFFEKEL
jgi:ribosomal protein S18 acetylase RimI-like enzyme